MRFHLRLIQSLSLLLTLLISASASAFVKEDLRYLALSEHRLNQIGDLYSSQGRGIVFHELAGPLEINDNNFNKSGLINMYLVLNGINPRLIESTGSLDVVEHHIQVAGGGVSGVGGGGDNFILSFVELLYSEMFLGLRQKRLTLEQFSLLLEKISKLEIQYLEDIPQGEFLLKNSVLWVPPNSATNKNVEKNYPSVNRLIVELLNGGFEK